MGTGLKKGRVNPFFDELFYHTRRLFNRWELSLYIFETISNLPLAKLGVPNKCCKGLRKLLGIGRR